ncbi:U3 small nucleolar RNA-associated protein 18 homolog [Halyomorpha halys]|uniref:U3 small nucleolar RNA-associated protein 18 homolog n=1 Tax=Halyomorpha halys TaxID=286706 RepID=UPI0006D4FBEF|nr:U3 small nucleolar RNA-associated protein 18 homolog [Halyomorpha halys]
MESDDETNIKRKRKVPTPDLGGKRKKINDLVDVEKERLEKLVLGDASYMLRNLGVGDNDSGVEDSLSADEVGKQPAWEDEDDLGISTSEDLSTHEERLRKKFSRTFGQPSWAKLGKGSVHVEGDEDAVLLRSSGNFISKPTYLPRNILNVKRLPSLNCETRNEGPIIKCVEFHPTSTVALVAGLSGTASILQVDGLANKKLASINFERFPIRCGHFSTDGKQFIVGSQHHSHFYVYDMMAGSTMKIPTHHNTEQTNMKNFEVSPDGRLIAVAGRFGQIHLLSASSKEWIANLTMNGNVKSLAFNPDGSFLYSHGDLGEVYVWDMNSRILVTKFADEGVLVGSSMAASYDYLATGSSWGVVNLYERPQKSGSPPKPLKAITNLVTNISSLKFNSTQQILAMASDEKYDQIKLLHLPSMTVFSNFPSFNSQLGKVQTFDFSPSSGYFSCANSKSTAYLYRLRHFGNY